jgi:hypothetical protein
MDSKGVTISLTITSVLLISAMALLAVGCGSTKLVNVWQDPAFEQRPMDKVLVVGMQQDNMRRRLWEDAFVETIKQRDEPIAAVPSYTLFPDNIPDTVAVKEQVQNRGFDGVLVVTGIAKEEYLQKYPGYYAEQPVTRYSPWWNAYYTHYETVYYPGYIERETAVRVAADLLSTNGDGRLVWSGVSETVDPASRQQVKSSVSDVMVEDLAEANLIL